MQSELIIAAAPVVTALVAAIGGAFPSVPRRYYPLMAIVAGMLWASLADLPDSGWSWHALLDGVVLGLTASGLYSGVVKPSIEAIRQQQ